MKGATATTLTDMCARRFFRWATSAMIRMANDIHSQTTQNNKMGEAAGKLRRERLECQGIDADMGQGGCLRGDV